MAEHLGKAGELWDKSIAYMKQNPKKGIFLLIFIAILIIVTSFLVDVGSNLTSFIKPQIQSGGYKPPSLELSYTKNSEKLLFA